MNDQQIKEEEARLEESKRELMKKSGLSSIAIEVGYAFYKMQVENDKLSKQQKVN